MVLRISLFLLFLFWHTIGFTQIPFLYKIFLSPPDSIAKPVVRKTVLTVGKFKQRNGDTVERRAVGFIIANKYLATCYHVFRPEDSSRPISMKIIYYPKNGFDSCDVDISGSLLKINNYNFSNHKYDKNDLLTDFIVLPLKQPSKTSIDKIDTSLRIDSSLYAFGNAIIEMNDKLYFAPACLELTKQFNFKGDDVTMFALLGQANYGWSGAPIFNSQGQIVAILSKGFDSFEEIEPLLIDIKLSTNLRNKIRSGYEEGKRIVLCTPIKYIYDLYLSKMFTKDEIGL